MKPHPQPDPANEPPLRELVGEPGFTGLVAAFYARVRRDELLAPMYPEGEFEQAEARLRDFLLYRFGVSDRYITERGHPRLRRRHQPFAIDSVARDRWLALMGEALEESELPTEAREFLSGFLHNTAHFLQNRPR